MPRVCSAPHYSSCSNPPIYYTVAELLEEPDNMAILQEESPTSPAMLELLAAVQGINPNVPNVCGTAGPIMLPIAN